MVDQMSTIKNSMRKAITTIKDAVDGTFQDTPEGQKKRAEAMNLVKDSLKGLGNTLKDAREQGYMKPIAPDDSTKDEQRSKIRPSFEGVLDNLKQGIENLGSSLISSDNRPGPGATFILALDPDSSIKFRGFVKTIGGQTEVDQKGNVVQ